MYDIHWTCLLFLFNLFFLWFFLTDFGGFLIHVHFVHFSSMFSSFLLIQKGAVPILCSVFLFQSNEQSKFCLSICFNCVYLSFTDPYLNTDAGTMSPFEHGEVFVLDDGGEVKRLVFLPCRCCLSPFLVTCHQPCYGPAYVLFYPSFSIFFSILLESTAKYIFCLFRVE